MRDLNTDGEVRQGQGQEAKAAQGLAVGGSWQQGTQARGRPSSVRPVRGTPWKGRRKVVAGMGLCHKELPDRLQSSSHRKAQAQETGRAFLRAPVLLGPELTVSSVP